MKKTCDCGGILKQLGEYCLSSVEKKPALPVIVCRCEVCGRLSLFEKDAQKLSVKAYEEKLADRTEEELILLAFTADTVEEREAAENVLWEVYHELASY